MKQSKNTVLHIITGLGDGGAESVLFRLCTHSISATHVVISLMDEGKYGSLLREQGIEVYCLGMNASRPNPIKFFKLVSLIRRIRPSIVQTWMYHADLIGGMAARVSGVKAVFWGIRHSTLEKNEAKLSTRLIALVCAKISAWVPKKIICCAKKSLIVHRELGYKDEKLVLIPNGFDFSKFYPDLKVRVFTRREFGIEDDTFLIGNVGRYHPTKDHFNFLKSISILKNNEINFKCLLVGKGVTSDSLDLVALIEDMGLSDSVILAGQRMDVPAIMNAIDLHVLSSVSEGFPNVLAEAMACGTPCISTDVGDASYIVGDQRLVCPMRDPSALSILIKSMHSEWSSRPDAWKRRQSSCVRHIDDNFSMSRMIDAYENYWGLRVDASVSINP